MGMASYDRTTIAAVFSLIIVSNFLSHNTIVHQNDIIADMTTVLIFGWLRISSTLVTNAQGLRWYMNRPRKSARGRRDDLARRSVQGPEGSIIRGFLALAKS